MKKLLSTLSFILLNTLVFSQVITPFTVKKTITQKGGILYLANSSCKAVPDNVVQNEMPPSGTGYDNNFTNGYIDIDSDATTFMSSSDQLNLPTCSEISWAGLYWGGACKTSNPRFATRNQVKLKINSGSYLTLNADYLKDNTTGYISYHCFKDITSYINTNGLNDLYTLANVVTDVGGKNLYGGWTIVIVYKNNTMTTRNLTVFDGLANVSAGASTVDIPISGFQTPLSGPVTFEIGLVAYDGDRSLTGDQLMFKGASSFINISDALHPSTDVFNSTISRNGVLTPLRNPNYNNTLGYDANIFSPNNTTKNYIGNNAISGTIRQTTGGETYLTQVVTFAIDVYEPDLRSAVRVRNLTHPGATNALPGDTLEYQVNGLNIGSDPSINTFITDTIEGNAFYIPNSIEILSGPNAGVKTDASGDDHAEYYAATKSIKVRIGTGANAYLGGQVNNSPSGADSTLFKFKVKVSDDCAYMYCDNTINNRAFITGTGNVSGNTFSNASNPGVFDSNGCAISGTTATPINTTGCPIPTASSNSPICQGGTINFTATSSPSATYLWTGPNGFTSTISNPTITNVQAINAGTYTANIYITGTSCHFVYPFVADISIANAGNDQNDISTCGQTTVTLAGNLPAGASGQWTIVSGVGGGFGAGNTSTSSDPNSTFSGVAGSSYVLRWTLTSSGCSPSTDDVTVNFLIAPSSASLSGAAATCNNRLNVAVSGGVSPYTVTIDNGVGEVTSYISGANITVTPSSTTTYTLLSVTGANGCPAVSISPNTYQIVVTNDMGTGSIVQNNAPSFSSGNTTENFPTAASTSSTTTNPWLNPTNGYSNNTTYATTTGASGSNSAYLYLNGFGFSIPSNAVIDGVVFKLKKKATGTITDSRVSLVNSTSALGSNKTIAGNWPTTDITSTYGTTTDLWGNTTTALTPAIVNSANFGVRIRAAFGTNNAVASVDYGSFQIYYHIGSNTYCDDASSVSFTATGYTGVSSYNWTAPTGATITSGQGTATAVMNFNGAGQSGNYSISVTPSNSCGSGTTALISIPITDCANVSPLCVSGNVYWDINGSAGTAKVDGTGIGIINSTPMYASIARTTNTTTCFATTPINANGTWQICHANITGGRALRVVLSKNNYAVGTTLTSLVATYPTGVSSNGEINNNIGNTLTGNDGTTNGLINFTTVSGMTNTETNLNFGLKINTPPVANPNTAVTSEEVPVVFNITNNDSDVDGTIVTSTVVLTSASSNGTWTVSNGNITYTPAPHFVGTATNTYTVKDNDNLTSNTASITVTVSEVNDAPEAMASSITMPENTTHTFNESEFNFTDVENDPMSGITISSLPSLGTLLYNGTPVFFNQTIATSEIVNLTYTPVINEYGSNYTSFNFKVNDVLSGSVTGTMTINVTHVAGPPVAVDDFQSTDQNTPITFNLLTNDTNIDGTLVASSVDLDPNNAGTQTTITIPSQGTFNYTGSGNITFTPEMAFYGTTVTIYYNVANSIGFTSNDAAINVMVIPSGAPVAIDDSASTTVNNSVTFSVTDNDTDDGTINPSRVDLDPYTSGLQQSYTVVGQGDFYVDINGNVTFQPEWNFNGVVTIHYTVKDNLNLVSNIAAITVTVNWANTAPFAVDDYMTTIEQVAVSINVTSNDYDLDVSHGNSGVINLASVDLDPATFGIQNTFTITNQGTFTVSNIGVVTFTPYQYFNGTVDALEYTVTDSDANPLTSNNGVIYVQVNSINDAPVAVNDTYSANVATTSANVTFNITNNDYDVDGTINLATVDLDPYTAGRQTSFSVSGEGVYTVDNLGNVTFNYTNVAPIGELTPINYDVEDDLGLLSNNGIITITILDGRPDAVDDSFTTLEDTPISFDVSENDTDTYGVTIGINPSSVTLIGTLSSALGTWSITNASTNPGEVTFTPATNANGTTSITYYILDLDGVSSDTATITVIVTPVNDRPSFTIGSNQTVCLNQGAQTVANFISISSAGPSDESSQTLSYTVTNSNNARFSVQPSISSNGTLSYTTAANQTGTVTVTVSIQDNGGTANSGVNTSTTQTFTITISTAAVAGTITGGTNVCTGTNSTTLTLGGSTGTRQWQSSLDNNTFNNIGGATATTYTATNLTTTTYYRVLLTNGACTTSNNTATISVSPTSVGGTVSGSGTVCSGTNSTALTLSGHTGNVTRWESSLASNFASPTTISNTTGSITVTNLVSTTYYRAVITSGACSSTTSSTGTITVSTAVTPTISITQQPNCTTATGEIQITSSPTGLTFSVDGSNYQSGTTFSSLNSGSYNVTAKNSVGCISAPANATINTQPVVPNPPTATNLSACVYSLPSSYVNDVNGFNSPYFKWYATSTGDTTSASYLQRSTATTYQQLITTTTTYYVSVVHPIGNCESARTTVTNTVIDPLEAYIPFTNDYIWKGGAVADDNDWNTITNWYQWDGTKYITVNTVPGTNDNVYIPPTGTCTPAQPRIQNENTQQFINLIIKPGGTLTVEGNGILNVSGNWENNGTFVSGNGVVNFVGAGNHTISGSTNTTFYDVNINKPMNGSSKSVLLLGQQIYITGQLNLNAGLFDISTYSIDMDNRSIIGGSAASYVKTSSTGFLRRVVGSNAANDDGSHVRFPIGRSNYNPAHLYNTGTDDTFSLRVYDIVSDNADENGTMTTLPVVERTWLVEEETIGGSSVDMKLYWNGTLENRVEELNSFDYTTAYIAHFNSAQSAWEDKGGSAPGGPGYAQTNNISNFSPFTISSGDAGLGRYSPLPVVLTKFETYCQEDNSIEIVWQTASEQNSDYFILEKSTDGVNWFNLDRILAAGNSTSTLNYNVLDNNVDNYNYYRLMQFDVELTSTRPRRPNLRPLKT